MKKLVKFMTAGVLPLFFLTAAPGFAASTVGGIQGTAHDAKGQPVAQATVVAHNIETNTDRTATSDAKGSFEFAKLELGRYEITVSKMGFVKSTAKVDVKGKNTQVALAMTQPPQGNPAVASELAEMKARIEALQSELAAKNGETKAADVQSQESGATTEAKAADAKPEVLIASRTADAVPALEPSRPASRPSVKEILLAAVVPPPVPAPAPAPAPQAAAPAAPAPPANVVPEALSAPEPGPAVDNFTFAAFGDFTWLNGTPRNKDTVLDTKFFTPEVRFDTHYMEDFNQPHDHTIVGATESFRSDEVQIEQISVGGDFHWQNVRGRVLYMSGLFATTTPRNDASFGIGQWDVRGAYKYTSEAYGGYHFNVNHGLNVDAGIFVSYIGLFSYYNFDNWTYQPSYVSSNTPWFFNGVRLQWFPTNKLKIEPWFINGWQSYEKYNGHPGLGGQLLWFPKEWFKLVANQYGFGQDNLGLPNTERIHTDDSIEIRFYNNPSSTGISKIAMSLTADAGSQYGGGLCGTCAPSKGKESFVGWMAYNRYWFKKDLFALTLGGGEMSNWGRYLTLLPPINGADAVTGSPYFPALPGSRAHMWDSTVTLHYMPKQYITWWLEFGYRHSDIPYFAGRGGVTPPGFPLGGTNGAPGQFACMSGAASGFNDLTDAKAACSSQGGVWFPDLRRSEPKLSAGVMVKF